MNVKVMRLASGLVPTRLDLPAYGTPGSAGVDLRAAIPETMQVQPGQRVMVPTGIALELPLTLEAQVRPRSGLAAKHGVTVLNSPGTIDADFRGEVCVLLVNHGDLVFEIERGDRIAQLVFSPVCKVNLNESEELTHTQRGQGGFGHTGVS